MSDEEVQISLSDFRAKYSDNNGNVEYVITDPLSAVVQRLEKQKPNWEISVAIERDFD